jgi:hypothetical protein
MSRTRFLKHTVAITLIHDGDINSDVWHRIISFVCCVHRGATSRFSTAAQVLEVEGCREACVTAADY